jgi:hypothetical protein
LTWHFLPLYLLALNASLCGLGAKRKGDNSGNISYAAAPLRRAPKVFESVDARTGGENSDRAKELLILERSRASEREALH